jgi:hypothetical protein
MHPASDTIALEWLVLQPVLCLQTFITDHVLNSKSMKTCFIILLSWLGVQAFAQVSIGAKSGLSLPGLQGNASKDKGDTWREAVYGGIYLRIQLNRLFYLQPELNYSPQGGERNGMQQVTTAYVSGIKLPPATTVYASFNKSTILHYLEIPVLVKMVAGDELTYSVCVGPYVSFLMSAKSRVRGNSRLYLDKNGEVPFAPDGEPIPVLSFNRNTTINGEMKKIAGGLQGGFGIGYPLRKGRLFFDARAIVGLTGIYVNPAANSSNRTRSWIMAVGYELDLK